MKNTRLGAMRRGFIKLGCLGPIIVIGLLWGGGQGVYTAVKNREPLKMSFKEYLDQRPSAEWVSLTGTQLNLLNSAYVKKAGSGEIDEVYIAVEPAGNREEIVAHVLLASKDKALIDLMTTTMNRVNAIKDPSAMTPELVASLYPVREVSGLMKFGIESSSKTREKLDKLDLYLTPDYIIISDGKKPDLIGSGTLLGIGVLGAFFLLRSSSKPAPAEPAPPPLPPIA
ncbi:hypothetical protein GCM10023213_40560 [Prosthecobacter algae]|uniref:Uncharacterized protein n=1 Tax=Prosthecobacter algae TaxID=1144682 RepID=A0ABP9PHS9_9BACT